MKSSLRYSPTYKKATTKYMRYEGYWNEEQLVSLRTLLIYSYPATSEHAHFNKDKPVNGL